MRSLLGIYRTNNREARRAAVFTLCAVIALIASAQVIHAAEPVEIEKLVRDSGVTGGLVVYVGSDDCAFPSSWKEGSGFLGHQLVRDRERLESVRARIRERDLYGQVSAIVWDGPSLPYVGNMVNLLVVSEECADLPREEVDRVLAPLGSAYMLDDGGVARTYRRPWPDEIDEWTHARYDSTGNAVSKDQRVGPPRHVQWYASPKWNPASKISSLVTNGGRIFAILDDSHIGSVERSWALVARDAFNGILLWRHELPSWGGAQGGKKVGPVQANRKLIAGDDRVYAPLGKFAPVSVINAATGKVLRTLSETRHAEEMVLSDGVLVVLINPNKPGDLLRGLRQEKAIVALDPETGELLWRHEAGQMMPYTLKADDRQVVYHDGKRVISLELRTGKARWKSPPTGQSVEYRKSVSPDTPGAEKSTILIAPQFAPTMMLYKDVVAFAGGRQINVLSAADGTELWRGSYAATNYSVPVDMFGLGGLIWGPDEAMNVWRPRDDSLSYNGYDLRTGTIKAKARGQYGTRFQHHRCCQMKAVGDKILGSRAGVEFLDTDTGDVEPHHWVRGSCYFGIMPANGLLYAPPHNCACFVRAKLAGFYALKADRKPPAADGDAESRFQRGPSYRNTSPDVKSTQAGDWPTYRHDPGRSGRASTSVGTELEQGWEARPGGQLTSPVVAAGRLFVAETDTHRILAYDADTGERLWQYSCGGRVDSPPTVYEGLVLCGSRDGWVYALRASDGSLVWRFRAAPESRWIVSRGQLESVWPVHGSVLVVDGVVYFAAGRSSYLDGGIHLYGLKPHSGERLFHEVFDSREIESPQDVIERGIDPVDFRSSRTEARVKHGTSQMVDSQGVDGFLNDVLSSDGKHVFMRHQVFDLEGNLQDGTITHLHGPDGYLSGNTTSRLQWVYAPRYTSLHQGAFYDRRLSRVLYPSGRILVEGDETIYGYGRNHYDKPNPPRVGGESALFASPKKGEDRPTDLPISQYRRLAMQGKVSIDFNWTQKIPVHVWAMLQSGDVLFVAGPAHTRKSAFSGKSGAKLLAVSATEGKALAEITVPAAPTWDGLAAARGDLFMTTRDGRILCLKSQ